MHVLILPSWYPTTPDDIGGSFFREQAIALTKAGCQVGVIAPSLRSLRDPVGAIKGSLGVFYEVDQCVDTYRLHAINLFPKMPRLAALWWKRKGIKLYQQYIKNHGRPDVIHVHSMLNAGLVATEIERAHNIPYVITEHSSSFARKLVTDRQRFAANDIASKASARFAVSEPFSDLLSEFLGSECGDWEVMPNIVNDMFFDGYSKNHVKEEFTFLNVCLLTENKRVDVLLEGFARSFAGKENVKLRIGGEGPEREPLMELAETLKIAAQVTFLGMLTRAQVSEEMERMDAFVLSSEYETFGVVIVEALAKGKPVIATRCGGPEDIVREEDGFLVPVNDVLAMAEAMEILHQNYSSFESEKIRLACKARYSESAIAQRLVEVYKSVMKNKSAVPL